MPRKKHAPLTPWEIAKPLLEKDYLERRILDHMMPAEVKQMRDEYKKCGKSFGSNLRRMQKAIRAHRSRAFKDAVAYNHDKDIHVLARDDDTCWDGSAAQKLLADDIKIGLHKTLKPRQLRLLREEYQVFDLDVFRPHIHQYTRSERETNYWIVKRKKKEAKLKARLNPNLDEDDLDFFEERNI